ncbi:hypothetical protein GGE07_005653 [Sinorhizobium terangae]|nr:hypothetical protein [Sinorhizobium terangae]
MFSVNPHGCALVVVGHTIGQETALPAHVGPAIRIDVDIATDDTRVTGGLLQHACARTKRQLRTGIGPLTLAQTFLQPIRCKIDSSMLRDAAATDGTCAAAGATATGQPQPSSCATSRAKPSAHARWQASQPRESDQNSHNARALLPGHNRAPSQIRLFDGRPRARCLIDAAPSVLIRFSRRRT